MEPPETRYINVGDAQVAYQVGGNAPEDLICCNNTIYQVDLAWQVPLTAERLVRPRGVRRLISFDRRGIGASDPVPLSAIPTWEELAEDMTAVLDAVGSTQTAVLATAETGPIAILFAAMHPERVDHLVLINATARFMEADDYPIGVSGKAIDSLVDVIATSWGTEGFTRALVPSYATNTEVVQALARMARASATPRTAATLLGYFMRTMDVRPFLPLVQAPTLIFHAKESQWIPVEHARYLAEHLPDATLVEWPGADAFTAPDQEEFISDIIEFLTGDRPVDVNRTLTTVLFTDIARSTELAASLGDREWRRLLDSHDRSVRDQLRRFRGREINTVGDGFVASFDGPARAIRCAKAIGATTRNLGLDVRAGLHTGECEVRGDDLSGLAVHIAARVGALAQPGEVLVSRTVADLVAGSGIEFVDRGEHNLKGVLGSWRVFAVEG